MFIVSLSKDDSSKKELIEKYLEDQSISNCNFADAEWKVVVDKDFTCIEEAGSVDEITSVQIFGGIQDILNSEGV